MGVLWFGVPVIGQILLICGLIAMPIFDFKRRCENTWDDFKEKRKKQQEENEKQQQAQQQAALPKEDWDKHGHFQNLFS